MDWFPGQDDADYGLGVNFNMWSDDGHFIS